MNPATIPNQPLAEENAKPLSDVYVARGINDKAAAVYLANSASPVFGDRVSREHYDACIEGTLKAAGDPSDPIERMLVDQIVMAHHGIGRLTVRAASATTEEAAVFEAAAVRLLAEFRRCVLTLKKYRQPYVHPVTVVEQQNVATNQQVAMVNGTKPEPSAAATEHPDTKLTSNRSQRNGKPGHNGRAAGNARLEHGPRRQTTQSAAGGRGQKEPVEA